jgi:hypothetical protein
VWIALFSRRAFLFAYVCYIPLLPVSTSFEGEKMPFADNVDSDCGFDAIPDQVANKVNEIAADGGRGHHGYVTLTDQTRCLHWRAGDYRIFGSFNNGRLNFIGYGMHTGQGDSRYKVNLCGGDTTKAMTS